MMQLPFTVEQFFSVFEIYRVNPCPATIFTFGVFLFASSWVPWYLFLLPLLWSPVGTRASITLHVPQGYRLEVAGVVSIIVISDNGNMR